MSGTCPICERREWIGECPHQEVQIVDMSKEEINELIYGKHNARIEELEAAGKALVEALDEALPAIDNAIKLETIHGRPYTGRQIGEELEALRATLSLQGTES